MPPVQFTPNTAEELIRQSERSEFPLNIQLKIQAANLLIPEQVERARSTLDNIDYDELPSSYQANLSLIQARIAELAGQNQEVFLWLDREPVINSNNPTLQTQAHILRAKAYNRYKEYSAALDEWTTAPDISVINQPELQGALWETLLNAPLNRLKMLDNQRTNKTLKGWLELATIYRPGKTIEEQINDLKHWRMNWQEHPANAYLPSDLNSLQSSNSQTPDKIALFLPLSGPLAIAGRAIRDGFIAVYYQNLSQQDPTNNTDLPELMVLDTHNKDINALALTAQQSGAELIIGPLNKDNVSQLKANPPQGITILALNTVDHESIDTLTNQPNFYEFSLSTEDEARSVAVRAFLDGHRRALILSPESDWGERSKQSFIEEWLLLGGEIAGEETFGDNTQFSKLTGEALLVSDSQNRAHKIKRVLRTNIGFEPRRREDVNMIFIPSSPKQARQLKPSLSYQYAGKLPVYATSSAYSGHQDSSKDQDLNNLRVPIMPWHLPNQRNPLENTIKRTWSNAKSQYGSLYALGADSYTLYPRLQQLASLSGSRLEGLTGWLSINKSNHIERELSWQIFRNGKLIPLPILKEEDVLATKTTEH